MTDQTNPDKDGFWDAISIRHPDYDAVGKPLDHSHAWGYVIGDPVGGSFSLFATTDGGESWYRRVATTRGPKGAGCRVDDFGAKADETLFAASNASMLAMNGDFLVFATGGSISRIAYTDLFSMDGAFCHESTLSTVSTNQHEIFVRHHRENADSRL